MTTENENAWLATLRQEIGIRPAVIVHGDVNDLRYCDRSRAYLAASEVARSSLHEAGYDHVIVWDQYSGVSNIDQSVWSDLLRESTSTGGSTTNTGNEYDVGDESIFGDTDGHGESAILSAKDFCSILYHHIMNPTASRLAFVVDWSQFLFGNSKALSEEERSLLLILSKAITGSRVEANTGSTSFRRGSVIVLLCNKISALPPVLYQDNPAVKDVYIPMPTRIDREAFIKRYIDRWKLRRDLSPGTIEFSDFVDSTEGLRTRDLQQLILLSHQVTGDPLTPERLMSLYRYGEQKSPWEDLSRDKLGTIEDSLGARVKGQAGAISKVSDVILRAFTGLSGLQHSKKQKMPKGVLFFVGPTGVGKTELAKSLAQFLFGDEDSCIRFDMSEFNHEHSDQRLVGAPPGYVGYEEGGQLTNAVKKRPFSVLLFDEIEKAHVRILDKFLQILEDGRLTDGKGETVYFSETIIIFTSNIGSSVVEPNVDTQQVRNQFISEVKEHFISKAQRPELLNRIGDNIVAFNFITDDQFLMSICRAKLQPLRDRLREKYRINSLEFDDEESAIKSVAENVDTKMGGRGVLNELVTRIIDPLSRHIFDKGDQHFVGRTIRISQAGSGSDAQFLFREV